MAAFLLAMLAVAAAPGSALAGCFSFIGGVTAMSCDGGPDTIVIEADTSTGLLRQNRFGIDADAASPFDWSYVFPGEQTTPSSGGVPLLLQMGGVTDSVTIGTPGAPAEAITRQIVLDAGSNAGDTLTIDNSGTPEPPGKPGRFKPGIGILLRLYAQADALIRQVWAPN